MVRVICLFIGYVFGLFQTAYIYGRMNGIDIREYGSGNAGTTNALRVLGKKAGIIVLLGDVAKTVLAVLLVRILFQRDYGDMLPLLGIYAAAGAILGHNYPVHLGFKGGKGDCLYGGAGADAWADCDGAGICNVFAGGVFDAVCVSGVDLGGD